MVSDNKNVPEAGNKFRYSIARKLSSHLFSRLLGIFLALDLIICVFVSFSIMIYSEQKAAAASVLIHEYELPKSDDLRWLEISGISIKEVTRAPEGFSIIWPFSYLLPDETDNFSRSIRFSSDKESSIARRLDELTYNVFVNHYDRIYMVSVALGSFMHRFRIGFTILLIFELLTLISRSVKDSRMIRRTLAPISELAKTAQSLNTAEIQFDPGKMAAMAGKLEGITASRLDTRIQVDETQEELNNLAQAINGMLDRINESYMAQVRFVSDASHELRTPISVIQGYASLLDRWGKNDEKTLQESIVAIKDEAANMKDLVEQLLFLARGDNNTIALHLENFLLSELASEVVHETQMYDGAHSIRVQPSNVVVAADRGLIKQALRILVDNAIKYTEPNGSIVLSVEKDSGFAKLSVNDDGIGISPEIVPRIFDRFYRAEESRARATGGAGLGLSIAKWIASRHAGHMEVLSREGIGTRITIALPLTDTAPSAAEASE